MRLKMSEGALSPQVLALIKHEWIPFSSRFCKNVLRAMMVTACWACPSTGVVATDALVFFAKEIHMKEDKIGNVSCVSRGQPSF
jgi:hypothetical protein